MGGETVEKQSTDSAASKDQPSSMEISIQNIFEYPFYQHTDNQANLLCRLTAPEYEPLTRPAVDICVVFDVSGSMSGEKLRLATETLIFIIRNLKATDRFSLVTFDSNVSTVIDLTTMDSRGKAKANDACSKLRAGSCTNLSGGLFEAIKLMNKRKNKAAVSSVLLMTDGMANEGIRDSQSLGQAMRKLTGDAPDYTVYSFGYGSDHDASMLKMISEYGGGMYYYIESNDLISASFGDCLGGLLSVVGQNITLEIDALSDGYAIEEVCIKKPSKIEHGGLKATVELGDLQSEETRDVLLKVKMPSLVQAQPDAAPCFSFKLSYVNVVTSSFGKVEAVAEVARPAECGVRVQDPLVQDAVDRHRAATAMEEAKTRADAGDFSQARALLSGVSKELGARRECSAQVANLCADLDDAMDGLSSASAYQAAGSHHLTSCAQSHGVQRSNRMYKDSARSVNYATKAKSAFRFW